MRLDRRAGGEGLALGPAALAFLRGGDEPGPTLLSSVEKGNGG